jgi:retinol dehydrogenase-14
MRLVFDEFNPTLPRRIQEKIRSARRVDKQCWSELQQTRGHSRRLGRNFAVNYLGPFLLTHQLLDLLKSSVPSRIINVSFGLAKNGKVDLDDLQGEKNYTGTKFYSSSCAPGYDNAKLMLMMFTYELARQLKGSGVTVNVLMPGFTATNLGRSSGSLSSYIMFKMVRPMQQSAKKGAETSIYLTSSDEVRDITGKCFAKKKEAKTCPVSYDEELQKRLFDKTKSMLDIAPEWSNL